MKNIALVFLMLISINSRSFGSNSVIPHEYVIQFLKSENTKQLINSTNGNDFVLEELNKVAHFYLIRFDIKFTIEEELNFLKSKPYIISYSPNKKLNARGCKPNDPNYKDQWNFAYMGFEEVWCYNKGGINELGDTIAIGVIDFGFN
ncbi:MAG: hypothetical protein ABIO44_12445, partial [Saprospiraceae bacterium]